MARPRILLVENDLILATAYQTRLEAAGFDVRHCINGEEALPIALDYQPDLILLDIMMPKASGFDILDVLHHAKATAHTKVIILAALSAPADQERARSLGANEYLIKSQAVIADVIKRIHYHLGLKDTGSLTNHD